MVSGSKKTTSTVARPPSALCNQKISRHDRNVTIMPPIKGPNAGPTRVPEKNHPSAVPLSVGVYMSPRHAVPTIRKEVPWKAVRMRKMK